MLRHKPPQNWEPVGLILINKAPSAKFIFTKSFFASVKSGKNVQTSHSLRTFKRRFRLLKRNLTLFIPDENTETKFHFLYCLAKFCISGSISVTFRLDFALRLSCYHYKFIEINSKVSTMCLLIEKFSSV